MPEAVLAIKHPSHSLHFALREKSWTGIKKVRYLSDCYLFVCETLTGILDSTTFY